MLPCAYKTSERKLKHINSKSFFISILLRKAPQAADVFFSNVPQVASAGQVFFLRDTSCRRHITTGYTSHCKQRASSYCANFFCKSQTTGILLLRILFLRDTMRVNAGHNFVLRVILYLTTDLNQFFLTIKNGRKKNLRPKNYLSLW